jgi:hypothetical protein
MRVRHTAARAVVTAGAVIFSLLATPKSARAQDLPLARLLPQLILREILLPGLAGPSHVTHFSPLSNDVSNPVIGIVQGFNTQMATQFSTFPLGSSSGGMTYVFDEAVGTFRRGSSSFGPSFAERALTIGQRKFSAGFNYQRTSYDTFEGQNLDDGSIKFYLRHQDCCMFNLLPGPPYSEFFLRPNGTRLTVPFEGDIIEASLSLKATTQTTAVFANYGVTDRWDIGLAVPFVRVNLDAQVQAVIVRLVTCVPPRAVPVPTPATCAPDVHTFEYGNPNATETVIEFVANPRLTVMGDFIGRTLRGAGRLDLVSKTFEYTDPFRLPLGFTPQSLAEMGISSFPTSSVSLDEFEPRSGDLTLLLGARGVKVNLAGNLLLSGSVLFPVTTAGLRSRLTTVVGSDYAF